MAWHELLNTPGGLGSLGIIVFVVIIAIGMGTFYSKKMKEDAANQK